MEVFYIKSQAFWRENVTTFPRCFLNLDAHKNAKKGTFLEMFFLTKTSTLGLLVPLVKDFFASFTDIILR